MAEPLNLNYYKSNELPPTLWRVTHANSQSQWNENGDMVAAELWDKFYDEDDLGQAVQRHVYWSHRAGSSCFLSVFSNNCHAQSWALRIAKPHRPACIYEIDTSKLSNEVHVLDMKMLMDGLGVDNKWPDDELLFLNRIPSSSISAMQILVDNQKAISNEQY